MTHAGPDHRRSVGAVRSPVAIALVTLAFPAVPAVAQDGDALLPCSGEWGITSLSVRGQSGGRSMQIRGGRNEGTARVEVVECGKRLRMSSQGQVIMLERVSTDPIVYEGQWTGADGAHRTLRFEVVGPGALEGKIVAHDARLRVDKPMNLTYLGGWSPQYLEGEACPEDESSSSEDVNISADEATQAVVQAMRDRGLTPPPGSGLTLEDYVWTRVVVQGSSENRRSVTRQVRLNIGPDGHILPSSAWMDEHRMVCRVDDGELVPPTKWLNFRLLRQHDAHDAVIQVIDIETGRIENQRMGEGGPGANGLGDAVDDAWNRLEVPIGSPTDGRVSG